MLFFLQFMLLRSICHQVQNRAAKFVLQAICPEEAYLNSWAKRRLTNSIKSPEEYTYLPIQYTSLKKTVGFYCFVNSRGIYKIFVCMT